VTSAASCPPSRRPGSARSLRIRGALAWTGGGLIENAAVVIDGSRTRYAGPALGAPGAEDELAGEWFLMPGVIDHHVHIRLSDPRSILHGGVTFCRDLGWTPEEIFPLVDISQGTDFEGPAVVAAGPMITAAGGYPSKAGWCPPGGWTEVTGAEEAAAAVEYVASQDPAVIKVALNSEVGPTLSDAELVAVCQAAHSRGLSVTAHVQGAGQTERALGAGIDELAHCPWTERLSDEVVSGLARNTGIVSTLDIHGYGSRTRELDVAVDNLRRFAEEGGRVRYGTDLGNGPIPPGIHAGEAAHLAAAGLSTEAILRSMTLAPLRPGAEGDLVGLRGNPFEDLAAFGRVDLVVSRGRVRRYHST
jgi:imidazolonepropionase-like amidohydrolase